MSRHPSTEEILQWFKFGQLPPHLQSVSKSICQLANQIADDIGIDGGPELVAGLRKLLEAKDCLVRAKLRATKS